MEYIPAPGGWGYRPGTNLGSPTPEMLPELPLLNHVASGCEMAVLVEAIKSLPDLIPHISEQMLIKRYGISKPIAHHVIQLLATLNKDSTA